MEYSRRTKLCALTILSILLTALFIISAAVQTNDENDVASYMTFYSLNAILTIVASLQQNIERCNDRSPASQLTKATLFCFYGLSILLGVWSIVLIGISANGLMSVEDPGDESIDNPSATEKENIGYEMGGASLGLTSVIYHVLWIHNYGT